MAELIKKGQPEDTEKLEPEGVDGELNIRAVVWTGAILVGVTVLSFVLMWFMYLGFISYEEGQDPTPSALPEAAEQALPPGPALQPQPEVHLQDYLDEQQMMLDGWAQLDEQSARIPIERAMEIIAERGGSPEAERDAATMAMDDDVVGGDPAMGRAIAARGQRGPEGANEAEDEDMGALLDGRDRFSGRDQEMLDDEVSEALDTESSEPVDPTDPIESSEAEGGEGR